MNFLIITVAILLACFFAFSKRLAASGDWKATVTPLASIMGSGFLVSAPLMGGIVGNYAVWFMGILLVFAYAIGSAIRFNIKHFEPIESNEGPAQYLALVSRIVLAGAYFISVSYYLQLLAAFLLNILGLSDQMTSHVVSTVLLISIGGLGIWRGMSIFEVVEKYAVAINLGMIGALLSGLAVYNFMLWYGDKWELQPVDSTINLHDVRVLLGLLIVVQGFETSRYLGDVHPANQRIRTMRAAQLISTLIYLVFVGLATILFHGNMGANVTAIVQMSKPVATVLPVLLTIAAIGSQFSAATADNESAGGLVEDITKKKIPLHYIYLLIMLITVGLTWATNVNQIIAYASRAFALFYSVQCVVAFLTVREIDQLKHKHWHLVRFALLAVFCFLVFAFGIPAEG